MTKYSWNIEIKYLLHFKAYYRVLCIFNTSCVGEIVKTWRNWKENAILE